MRVWKIVAGRRSKFLKAFIKEGIAALKTREAENKGKDSALANQGKLTTDEWNFINGLKEGDLLLLYKRGYISALGCVTGDYAYDATKFWKREKFFHTRPTVWRQLDTVKQKLPSHLKKTLSNMQVELQEVNDREDILDVVSIATAELFNEGTQDAWERD